MISCFWRVMFFFCFLFFSFSGEGGGFGWVGLGLVGVLSGSVRFFFCFVRLFASAKWLFSRASEGGYREFCVEFGDPWHKQP